MFPWYWVVGGARGGPSYIKEGDICSYAPVPNYTDFQQKNLYVKLQKKTFSIFV